MALNNGGKYVSCTNRSCGYFCAVEDLPTYERAVQLEVSPTFFRERFSALATQETLRLEGVTVREESLEALFWLCIDVLFHLFFHSSMAPG